MAGRRLGRQAQINPVLISTIDQMTTSVRLCVISVEERSRRMRMVSRTMETTLTKQPSEKMVPTMMRWPIGAFSFQI